MIRNFVPLGLLFVVACGGGGDGVTPPATQPSDITSMNVGDVRVFTPANIASGLDLASSSAQRDYIVIVGNTSPVQDVVANYIVKADVSAGGSFAAAPTDLAAPRSNVVLGQPNFARTPQRNLEQKLRAFERRQLALHPTSDPLGLSRFSARGNAQVSAASIPVPGDVLDLKIPDANSNNLCENFFTTRAVVASVSRRAILAVDTLDGPPTLLFTQTQLDSITKEFDDITFPTDSSYFGKPTDVDGNGHIIILFSGQINKLTPPGQTGFVGGFFFAGDFFPVADQGQGPGSYCKQSNNGEIFYLLSPDPTGRFGNVRSVSSVRQGTRGTIAHEFQHMINSGNRFLDPTQCCFESTWLDEGLAHFAEDAVGRVQRGFGDFQTLTLQDLVPAGNAAANNDFNAFFYQNLARLTYWMERPDTSSGISSHTDQNLSSRGAAWSLVRWSVDNFSKGDARAMTRKLAAGPDTGTKNFTVSTKQPLDSLISGWLITGYSDHFGIAGLDPKYNFKSYNMRAVMPAVAQAVLELPTPKYPLQVLAIGTGNDNISSTNRTGSGTYYRLLVPANSGAKKVKVLDTSGSLASFPGAHIYVLRVQ